MEELKQRIREDGVVLPGNVLKGKKILVSKHSSTY